MSQAEQIFAIDQALDRLVAIMEDSDNGAEFWPIFDRLEDRVPGSGVASALAVPSGQSRERVSLRLAG